MKYKNNMSEKEVMEILDEFHTRESIVEVWVELRNCPVLYEIVLNSDANKPVGDISNALFDYLQDKGILSSEDCYDGGKARRIFEFN